MVLSTKFLMVRCAKCMFVLSDQNPGFWKRGTTTETQNIWPEKKRHHCNSDNAAGGRI